MNTNSQLNLLELLRDCKDETQFYSIECGKVVFHDIEDNYLLFYTENGGVRFYDFEGYSIDADSTAEPILFPSKDVRNWSFYKVRYIKVNNQAETIKAIEYFEHEGYMKNMYITDLSAGGVVYIDAITHKIKTHSTNYLPDYYDYILSTGTELKLKEKQPKFKVGDIICDNIDVRLVSCIKNDLTEDYLITPEKANEPEQVYRIATPEEITKWNKEVLEPNHLHYSKNKREITYWFLPFDKVIVKEEKETHWRADFFSNKENEWYCCMSGNYERCLPYNGKTVALIGTTGNYEEK